MYLLYTITEKLRKIHIDTYVYDKTMLFSTLLLRAPPLPIVCEEKIESLSRKIQNLGDLEEKGTDLVSLRVGLTEISRLDF